MSTRLALGGLIFLSAQTSAIINEVDAGAIGATIRQSAVKLMTKRTGEPPTFRCSAVLVGRRYVMTAFHCVAPSQNLWYAGPDSANRVIEFEQGGKKSPIYIKVKSINYPSKLKEIHTWGIQLDEFMADLEEEIKTKVFVEGRIRMISKLGGDPSLIDLKSENLEEDLNLYLKKLVEPINETEQRRMLDEYNVESDKELTRQIRAFGPEKLDSFVQSRGFKGTYSDFDSYVRGLDIAILELEGDAPKSHNPVSIAEVDLREGSDLQAWAAGSGNFGNFGDEYPTPVDIADPVMRIGKVKIARRDGMSLVMRANPSRICQGDSGGPLYVELNGKVVLVGIHASVDYADDQERLRMVRCMTDVDTRSTEIMKFKELLVPGILSGSQRVK